MSIEIDQVYTDKIDPRSEGTTFKVVEVGGDGAIVEFLTNPTEAQAVLDDPEAEDGPRDLIGTRTTIDLDRLQGDEFELVPGE